METPEHKALEKDLSLVSLIIHTFEVEHRYKNGRRFSDFPFTLFQEKTNTPQTHQKIHIFQQIIVCKQTSLKFHIKQALVMGHIKSSKIAETYQEK